MSPAYLNRQQASESVWISLMNIPRPASEGLTEAPRVGWREIKKTATRKTKQDTCDYNVMSVNAQLMKLLGVLGLIKLLPWNMNTFPSLHLPFQNLF